MKSVTTVLSSHWKTRSNLASILKVWVKNALVQLPTSIIKFLSWTVILQQADSWEMELLGYICLKQNVRIRSKYQNFTLLIRWLCSVEQLYTEPADLTGFWTNVWSGVCFAYFLLFRRSCYFQVWLALLLYCDEML